MRGVSHSQCVFFFFSKSYHILVLSQGANWRGPPGFPQTDAGVKEHLKSLQSKFSKAKDIVLAGGGAVGFGTSPHLSYSVFHASHRNPIHRTRRRDQGYLARTFQFLFQIRLAVRSHLFISTEQKSHRRPRGKTTLQPRLPRQNAESS